MSRDIMDDDGENLAVRAFLLYYGGGNTTCPIISMRAHLAHSGFDGCWPAWAAAPNSSTLTKAGAQLWLRHLFSLEHAAPTHQPAPQTSGKEGDS